MATYTFVSKHLFNDHNDIYHFKNWDEAYEFVKTIDWYQLIITTKYDKDKKLNQI